MFVARNSVLYVLYGLAAVPLLLVGGAGFWLYNDIGGTARKFEDALLDAAGAQVPIEPAEFARLELPPKDQDAGAILDELDYEWSKLPADYRAELQQQIGTGIESPAPANMVADAQRFTRFIEQASARSDSVIQREWASSEGLIEPYYHSVTESARLAASYARTRAHNGDIRGAFRTLNSIRKVAKHISRDSGFDGMALHIILETQALTTAQEIALDNPSSLDDFAEFIKDQSNRPDLIRNLEGEAMRSIYVLMEPDSFQDRMFSGARLSIRNDSFQRAAAVRMIEFWCQAVTAIRPVAADPFQARLLYREQTDRFGKERTPSRLIASTIAEWNQAKLNLNAALDVRYKLAKASIPVLRSYHKAGEFPQAAKIDGDDPYGSGSFGYAKTKTGFRLSSVGRDHAPTTAKQENDDIVLIIENGRASHQGI